MLASASPLFEDLPGTFADPLGLADQQAAGVVALIVARYDDTPTNVSIAGKIGEASNEGSPSWTGGARGGGPTEALTAPTEHDALAEAPPSPTPSGHPPSPPQAAATYDTFVAASGGLVAVARTTPDYRFPVAPAAAVARFHHARDEGHAPTLSLFSVAEADAARFLETAFYAECLKVHIDGPASADLVRTQLARCGCASGLLEAQRLLGPRRPHRPPGRGRRW